MTQDNSVSFLSRLSMPQVAFDEVSFNRTGFRKGDDSEVELEIGTGVRKIEDGRYDVSLSVTATKQDEYVAKVRITGYCKIDESTPHKTTILEENAIAILFAYVRSELTLITSQPETDPIILPVVNINEMIKQGKKHSDT